MQPVANKELCHSVISGTILYAVRQYSPSGAGSVFVLHPVGYSVKYTQSDSNVRIH